MLVLVCIIKVGGAVFGGEGEEGKRRIEDFAQRIERFVEEGRRAIIVVGGGQRARGDIERALMENPGLSTDELDRIGINATIENAVEAQCSIPGSAESIWTKMPTEEQIRSFLCGEKKKVQLVSGWKPGMSTDAVAVMLQATLLQDDFRKLASPFMIKVTFSPLMISKTDRAHRWVRLSEMSEEQGEIVPGGSYPFDPVAVSLALEHGISVIIGRVDHFMEERDGTFYTFDKFIKKGTIITP